jgi:hypothetical protein
LATLDGATKNRNDPITFALPKVAKASTVMSRWRNRTNLRQWKYGLKISLNFWQRSDSNCNMLKHIFINLA